MSEQNKAMVHNLFDEVWNQGNLAIIDERLSADYVGHSVTEIQGPEGAKQFVTVMRGAFPDYH